MASRGVGIPKIRRNPPTSAESPGSYARPVEGPWLTFVAVFTLTVGANLLIVVFKWPASEPRRRHEPRSLSGAPPGPQSPRR
jgi:hypothetical protein